MSAKTIYFAYGSNLWLDQMKRRCPESKWIGLAGIKDWRVIINSRGYCNIIPSPGHVVYGFAYELTPSNESDLDRFEGKSYKKRYHSVEIKAPKSDAYYIEALIYIDEKNISDGVIKEEYIHRMNMGIADALERGISQKYVDKYLRRYIPPTEYLGQSSGF
ncbi:hypothetical protein B0H34DRAFT_652018 [Crassisporium funariophilum]|nr:hypothetical protein B0H34DRAFT_652018 [Crassisporium funariophilum]